MHRFWRDILRPCKYIILQTLYSPVLASIDDSRLDQLLLWWLPNGNFSSCHHSFYVISWDFTVRKSFPSPPCICLVVCLFISVWTPGFWFYSTSYHLFASWFILMLILSQIWLVESLWAASYVLLRCLHHSLSTSDTFWHNKMFQAHLVFSLLQLWSHFCKEPWFLSVRNGI